MSIPKVEAAHSSAEPKIGSPLSVRLSLLLVASVVGLTVTIFGVGIIVILKIPGAREYGLVILGASVFLDSLLILVVMHLFLRRAQTGWRALGFVCPTSRLLHLLWQAPALLLVLLIVQGVMFTVLGGDPVPEGDGIDGLIAGVPLPLGVLILLSVVILVPLWEESLFRGVIYGGFRRKTGVLIASLLSAAIFAAAHGYPILLPYIFTLVCRALSFSVKL